MLFKKRKKEYLVHRLDDGLVYQVGVIAFRMKMFILFGMIVSVTISSFIPWFLENDRFILIYFFLVIPLFGWCYFRSTGEKKRNIKKLKAIYNKYSGSLTLEEENAIKNFLLKDCSIEEFYSDDETLRSLELKQIIHKSSRDKKEIYRMERWAFDYFHVYKLNMEQYQTPPSIKHLGGI